MTIEQLEKANEIAKQIKWFQNFKKAFDDTGYRNDIVARHFKYPLTGESIEDKEYLYLGEHPKLTKMISDYISEQITELEKQLEEI